MNSRFTFMLLLAHALRSGAYIPISRKVIHSHFSITLFPVESGIRSVDGRRGLAYLGFYCGFSFQEEYFDATSVSGRNLDSGWSSTSALVHAL